MATITVDSNPTSFSTLGPYGPVTFVIPPGLWSGAQWSLMATPGADPRPDPWYIYTVFPKHSVHWTVATGGTISASSDQLADIQAAAGSSLSTSVEYKDDATSAGRVNRLQLLLTGTPYPDHCAISPFVV